jgi:hypothetical protein
MSLTLESPAVFLGAPLPADPQLSFAVGSPGAPNTIFIGTDASANDGLTLQISTNTTTTLTPGKPDAATAGTIPTSLICLDLSALNLGEPAFKTIQIGDGWAFSADAGAQQITLAPATATGLADANDLDLDRPGVSRTPKPGRRRRWPSIPGRKP